MSTMPTISKYKVKKEKILAKYYSGSISLPEADKLIKSLWCEKPNEPLDPKGQ